jgi:PAS domain S-box-containing protein
MDLAKENSRLKLRVRELEACLEELNPPACISGSPDQKRPAISHKSRFDLLTELQALCKSGYMILSLQKEFIEYSSNMKELLGLPDSPAKITYAGYMSSIIPGDRQRVEEIIRKHLVRENDTSTAEFKVKGTDRYVQYIKQHCRVSPDTAHGNVFVFMILHNVTEQRRMERKLVHSENKFRSIFSSTPLGMIIYTIDAKGDLLLTDMNPAAREMLKIQDESLIGKPIEMAFPALAKTSIPMEFKKVACDGVAWRGSNITYDSDKRHNIVDISAFQTSLGTTAVIFQDITEKIQVENRLKESEEKYRTLVDNSNVAVFTSTPEGKLVFINDAGCRILEYSDKNEILREKTNRFYAARGARDLFLRQLKKRKEVSDFRVEFLTKNNRSIMVSISAKIENDLISGVFMDISEKVKAEQKLIDLNNELQEINEKVNFINAELQKSEALKKALLNNLPHMAWMKDLNGMYLSVNESFTRSLNLSPHEVTGKTDKDLYEESIAAGYKQEDDEVMEKRREHFYYEKTGSLWFETYKAPIFNESGEIIGVSGISLEITERKQAEEEIRAYSKKLKEQNEILRIINDELVRAKEKAEESDKLKSSFLANMSHEIRTPMNAILGFANLLKNKSFPDERKLAFIDIINSKSKQLLQIITDIIDISKIEAGQISIFNKSFPVNAMIKELYLSFDNLRKQDHKPFSINYSVGLPDGEDSIFSDKIRIEQILSNFLSNAYKFTDTGKIEVGYRIENASILFFVRDTGIGIAPGEQKVIFDRFRQVESSHSRSYSGTGLGLAISKGLAGRMNGHISVKSETGKGSVFYLTLPYTKQPSAIASEKIFDESSFDWSDKTILIAEDEEDNYTFLEVLLKVTGARIIWARNGLEAVSLCRKHSDINLVLMDIKMPVLDGLEATRQIKKLRTTLPVIVQTAYAMAADEEQCLKSGCDAYVSKPIKIEPLFKLIKKYI